MAIRSQFWTIRSVFDYGLEYHLFHAHFIVSFLFIAVTRMVSSSQVSSPLSKDDFHLLKVIGKGSFGKVLLVRSKRDRKVYALKILMKSRVLARKQVEHTKSERKILEEIDHPFLCRLEFAFQTEGKLYIGMDFLAGGPLFYHLQQCHHFPEERAKFYVAEVIVGIGHLHEHNILYRDMKPENLLLDRDGHVIITDFGLSKLMDTADDKVQTICGKYGERNGNEGVS